jgi:DHA2 family multidrug resistance protein
VFASLISRFHKQATASIGAHLVPGRAEVADRLSMITHRLESHGYDVWSAKAAAGRLLGGLVARQSMVLTFEKLFLLSGILFLVALPLLIFLKSPDHQEKAPAEVHVEI